MRTLVFGDIHGSAIALQTLLEHLAPEPDDHLIFLGDYIDRGPASRRVIETLVELKATAASSSPVFLRGNHEVMMLDAREGASKRNLWLSYGGIDTLESYGTNYQRDWVSVIPEMHWSFLEATRTFYETESHIFVHACVDPELEMNQQPSWLLYWEPFDKIRPHFSGKIVVCGHTPQRSGEIKDVGFAVCIDTRAAGEGWLTCLEPDARHYWQANEKGKVREGAL